MSVSIGKATERKSVVQVSPEIKRQVIFSMILVDMYMGLMTFSDMTSFKRSEGADRVI